MVARERVIPQSRGIQGGGRGELPLVFGVLWDLRLISNMRIKCAVFWLIGI